MSYYWKTDEIELPKHIVSPVKQEHSSKELSDYTIHYTPTSQIRNGRTHHSFRAHFVKDRLTKETPHTIIRSYDVPPPVRAEKISDRLKLMHRRSQTKRTKTISESDPTNRVLKQNNFHSRSMSVGDELTNSPTVPVPKPRHKPVPAPRRSFIVKPDVISIKKSNPPIRKPKQNDWQEVSLISSYNNSESGADDTKSTNEKRIAKHINSVKLNTVNNSSITNSNDVISHTILSWV